MAAANFQASLQKVLVHEGGYSNHPNDPGGATMKGVTQATYNDWRRRQNLSTRSVRSITNAEVAAIYERDYWRAVRGDDLPSGVDYAVFDFGVNSGPRRAIEFLQRIVGVDDDGVIGPVTLRAISLMSQSTIIEALCSRRLGWLKGLKTWGTFGRGWTNRVNGVRSEALKMVARAPAPVPIPPPPDIPAPLPEPSDPPKRRVSLSRVGITVAFLVAAAVVILIATGVIKL